MTGSAFYVTATLPNSIFGMETTLRTDIRHTGAHKLDDFGLFKRPSVRTANFSVNMRRDNLMIRLFVNNLTDEEDPLHVHSQERFINNPAGVGMPAIRTDNGYLVTPRRPREVGISVNYSFN